MKNIAIVGFIFGFSLNLFGLEKFEAMNHFEMIPQQVRINTNPLKDGFFKTLDHVYHINLGHFVLDWMAGNKSYIMANEHFEIIKLLDQEFGNILSKEDYNYIAATKQSYILPDIKYDDFGKGIDIFQDLHYQDLVMNGITHKFDNNQWITIKTVPWYGKIFCSDFVGVNNHYKISKSEFIEEQNKVFSKIEFGIPDRIGVTFSKEYYFKDSASSPSLKYKHDKVKASSSITLYYSINNNQDLLVITYQLVLGNAPKYISSDFMGKFVGMFTSGTKKSIEGTRQYFYEKKSHIY